MPAFIGVAPAKLNLRLSVLGRRPDGHHDVATLMVPISLCDTVRVRPAAVASCRCEGVPGENLAARAAELLGARVAISIDKRIPVGAGLGGGSSDAACVLRLLSAHDRIDVASRLGSDVPFFLTEGPAWATGTGTDVVPVDDLPPLHAVLVVPPGRLSTAEMYAALHAGPSSGERPPPPELGGSLDRLCENVGNDFLDLCRARVPPVDVALSALRAAGACVASLSGKGPACFGLFESAGDAALAQGRLKAVLPREFLVAEVCHGPCGSRMYG
jgi:4-diphosphocytidyl-2-C-methyl-D-erythritol kinase